MDFYQSLPMTILSLVIVAEMHLMTILAEAFHLIANLFRDAAHLRETVIYQKQYLHPFRSCNFSLTSIDTHSLYNAQRFCL